MANATTSATLPKTKELVITRTFRAPRERVWKAWTDPEMFKLWWGPRGYSTPVAEIDLREGGRFLGSMRSPEGNEVWSTGEYQEIVPLEKLVVTDSFADENGNVVPATYYGMSADFPMEMMISVTFQEQGGTTQMTLTHSGIDQLGETDVSGMQQGWNESFDKLAELLEKEGSPEVKTLLVAEPGTQEIRITREFEAPRELVFRAFTDPNLYAQWMGPRRLTMHLETFEPRDGGRWRYVQTDESGQEFGFHGVNHEVHAPERIIGTFEYEGLPERGHVLLQTARFEELPGNRTRVHLQSVFQSVQDRDGMLQSGMEEGMNESFDRLDELLERMQRD